jgi:GT2 family glycosyltransferase
MSLTYQKYAPPSESSVRTRTSSEDTILDAPKTWDRARVDGKFLARGQQRLRIQGVTYGPFAPNTFGQPFPCPAAVADDFARMRAAHINALRTYHVPPEWLLSEADEQQLNVFIDVPWPKHLCFLDSAEAQRDARRAVQLAARCGQDHPCVLAYSIANEIPTNIIRWHGALRVERFLMELQDVVKQTDPDGLVTYANYPPTEYLDLSFLDFATLNVYLHDRATFRRYLCRLQNLVGDRPLLLGEIGMDTLRQGEEGQAHFLGGHVEEATLMGLAGVFVFSWTDDWHTGGHPITDWAFGITYSDRLPKPSCHALREVFERSPAELLPLKPKVSVVVCSYNGGRTMEQCLRSLRALDYPDYEVIVVDDGSTDATPEILKRFPEVRAIRQTNQGLSVARNVGLHAATGSIVAYTDDDCFADPDWLTLLVHQLERSGAHAVGGPNLTPEDGTLAACVAASPGQPTHVLESDQVAEHIPGCNMAFRREALLAINGFDPLYRKAGDDVDVCWRLQQAGMWITFSPGAFVWHHRRQNPRAYLKQQAGYGEAEALLRFQHPERFNAWGHGKWRGVLYGAALQGLRLCGPIIYHGTFGSGLFQCVYQPGAAHWAMLPSTLEWHLGVVLVVIAGLFWSPAWWVVAPLLGLSVLVAILQAVQARIPAEHDGLRSRCVVALLCYLQPLVRSWARYRTRLSTFRASEAQFTPPRGSDAALPLTGRYKVDYWSEEWRDRTELLDCAVTYLNKRRCGLVVDTGWSNWDLQIVCHPWTIVEVRTAQEDHGSGKRLIRVRYRVRASAYMRVILVLALISALGAALLPSWYPGALALVLFTGCIGFWCRGVKLAAHAVGMIDALAGGLGLIPCPPRPRETRSGAAAPRAGEETKEGSQSAEIAHSPAPAVGVGGAPLAPSGENG